MIKEAIGIGDSVEEAKENALAQLNAKFDDDIQFEVLATPKKKILGFFGGSPAKVRVFIEKPEPVQPKKAAIQKPVKSAQPYSQSGRAVSYIKSILKA